MSEIYLLIFNIGLYVAACAYFFRRNRHSFTTYASYIYLTNSVFSLLYYLTPVYNYSPAGLGGVVNLPAVIWLFVFNFLLCYTLRYFDIEETYKLENYHSSYWKKIQIFLCLIYGLYVIYALPGSIENLMSSDLSDIRNEYMSEGLDFKIPDFVQKFNVYFSGLYFIILLIPAIKRIVLHEKLSFWDYTSLIIYVLYEISKIGEAVSRSSILHVICDIFLLMMFLRHFLHSGIIRKIALFIIPILYVLFSIMGNITEQRYGDNTLESAYMQQVSIYRYAGESQLDFFSIMYDKTKGNTWGYRTFSSYRKVCGLDYYGKDKTQIISQDDPFLNKTHPYDNHIFYGAGGNWYWDWGKYMPIIMMIILNILISRNRTGRTLNVYKLIFAHSIIGYVFFGIFFSSQISFHFVFFALLFYLPLRNTKPITIKQ